jgi:hypothetical protein
VSLVWGTHALPLYWEVLKNPGNSDLKTQKRLLGTVLPLFKNCRVLVLGDREFHSPKLASWLDAKGVSFALRQKKDLHFQEHVGEDYQVLKALGFKPGMSQFYKNISCNTAVSRFMRDNSSSEQTNCEDASDLSNSLLS